jgi:hypothetical protein
MRRFFRQHLDLFSEGMVRAVRCGVHENHGARVQLGGVMVRHAERGRDPDSSRDEDDRSIARFVNREIAERHADLHDVAFLDGVVKIVRDDSRADHQVVRRIPFPLNADAVIAIIGRTGEAVLAKRRSRKMLPDGVGILGRRISQKDRVAPAS